MGNLDHPTPVWRRKLSRVFRFLEAALSQITVARVAIVGLVPLLFYIYSEVTHDALVIDPFTVPKRFEKAGLTSEVMANRIGDALSNIEATTQTRMKKDNLIALRDEGGTPDVEIPGTNIGLKTLVDTTRAIFGFNSKHLGGDVVFLPTDESRVTVTFYVTEGKKRSPAVNLILPAADVGALALGTAEMVLAQVNPYVLAVYREGRGELPQAIEVLQRMLDDPAVDHIHAIAAFNLMGMARESQGNYDEAAANFQRAIALDPKAAPAHNNLGIVLDEQKKYDYAEKELKRAIEIDPKYARAYNNLGIVLLEQKKFDEAVTRCQQAIEINPNYASAYNNLGIVFAEQKKYDEANSKFKKATDIDHKFVAAYDSWGDSLSKQGKFEEAIAKYQTAIEIDPKHVETYNGMSAALNNWGNVLRDQGKVAEAEEKFAKAREISSRR